MGFCYTVTRSCRCLCAFFVRPLVSVHREEQWVATRGCKMYISTNAGTLRWLQRVQKGVQRVRNEPSAHRRHSSGRQYYCPG
jgi:hypothetical protein